MDRIIIEPCNDPEKPYLDGAAEYIAEGIEDHEFFTSDRCMYGPVMLAYDDTGEVCLDVEPFPGRWVIPITARSRCLTHHIDVSHETWNNVRAIYGDQAQEELFKVLLGEVRGCLTAVLEEHERVYPYTMTIRSPSDIIVRYAIYGSRYD